MSRDFDEDYYAIRIGSLILHNIGQLLPLQLSSSNFHNRDFIYPVSYLKAIVCFLQVEQVSRILTKLSCLVW